jgi:TRAP-type uncharacterized transport system substrate-binding protein
VVMGALWTAWLPMPPSQLTFSTGRTDGAYYAYAQRYAKAFAAQGIEVVVVPSDGAEDNLKRLRGLASPIAQLAFLQGGTAAGERPTEGAARIETIARVDLEPVWLFTRQAGFDGLQQLQGLRVSLGNRGSGTRKLALSLLEQVRLSPRDVVESELAGLPAVQALRQGALDAVFVVASAESPVVRALLQAPGVHLAQLSRSTALTERLPSLQLRLLPQGSLDASGRLPPRDTAVLVSTASLVAREDLHPALQRLAAATARDIHGGAGLVHRAGEFPNLKRLEFPASQQGRQVLAHGLPWLEENLPFWWAQVVLRLLVICLPVALLAWWLAHMLPAYLRWLVESRLARWYGELKYIEFELARDSISGLDATRSLHRLDGIEKSMADFSPPSDLMPRWFSLRKHIDFVRLSLLRQRGR